MKRLLCIGLAVIVVMTVSSASAQTITVDDIGADYEWGKYESYDGAKLDLFVFRPAGHSPSDSRTAVVCIHGGGWVGGKPEYFFPHCEYFSKRGAVAFSIRYRLVEERGIGAFDEVERCIADCKAAIRYIRNHAGTYGIDPDRIAVLGDSAGGHLAACLAVMGGPEGNDADSMANAAVCYNPCVDMDIPLVMRIFGIEGRESGGETVFPENVHDRARDVSPIGFVRSGQPPVLVMHGTEDTVVPPEQSRRFTEAMTAAGNRSELIMLDGEKHAFVIVGIGTEKTIVGSLWETDRFLASLGFLEGEPLVGMR